MSNSANTGSVEWWLRIAANAAKGADFHHWVTRSFPVRQMSKESLSVAPNKRHVVRWTRRQAPLKHKTESSAWRLYNQQSVGKVLVRDLWKASPFKRANESKV